MKLFVYKILNAYEVNKGSEAPQVRLVFNKENIFQRE